MLANVLWLVVEIFYFFCFFRRIQDQWKRFVNLAIFMMIWLPDSYFQLCAILVLAYECGWVRCNKSMPFERLFFLYNYFINLFNIINMVALNPSVLFFTTAKESS